MYYFIVRKSNQTYYCGAFTISGFCDDWADCSFYVNEDSAKKICDGLAEHYKESFNIKTC